MTQPTKQEIDKAIESLEGEVKMLDEGVREIRKAHLLSNTTNAQKLLADIRGEMEMIKERKDKITALKEQLNIKADD